MNSLSWMIYLAGVSGGLVTITGLASGISGLGFVFAETIGRAAVGAGDATETGRASFSRTCLIALLPSAILCALIPTKDTVYAIAASEMGEQALNTKTGGKAVEALNAWLDRQIKGDEK